MLWAIVYLSLHGAPSQNWGRIHVCATKICVFRGFSGKICTWAVRICGFWVVSANLADFGADLRLGQPDSSRVSSSFEGERLGDWLTQRSGSSKVSYKKLGSFYKLGGWYIPKAALHSRYLCCVHGFSGRCIAVWAFSSFYFRSLEEIHKQSLGPSILSSSRSELCLKYCCRSPCELSEHPFPTVLTARRHPSWVILKYPPCLLSAES